MHADLAALSSLPGPTNCATIVSNARTRLSREGAMSKVSIPNCSRLCGGYLGDKAQGCPSELMRDNIRQVLAEKACPNPLS